MDFPLAYSGFIFGNKFFESYNQMNTTTHKNLILEPLSCVLKLCVLQHKEIGTKISVHDNQLTFNEPSLGQGLFRSWYGHRREDLHNLYNPLRQCLQWYDRKNEIYAYVYRECVRGLRLLLQTYDENTTIHHTLLHYISLLESEEDPEPPTETPPTNPIVERLRTLWTESEIKVVYDILRLIQSDDPQSAGFQETYLHVLEDIIESKEQEVSEYISQVSTTY